MNQLGRRFLRAKPDQMRRTWPRAQLLQILSAPWLVPLLVFIGFFLLNVNITGPAYLSDEIGYLSKASTIAGYPIHYVNSWYGGYSLLIAPAFLLTTKPHTIWLLILLLNALMWAGSAGMLRFLLRRLYPTATNRKIQLVTLGALVYPSWVAMSGYALATSGFVLVLLAVLTTLVKSEFRRPGWLILAGLLVGYLCWIHPVGYVFLLVFASVIVIRLCLQRQYNGRLIGLLMIGLVIALSYTVVVVPVFAHLMNGSDLNDGHYTAQAAKLLHAMERIGFWRRAGTLLISLLLYPLVSTFGIAVYAVVPYFQKLRHRDGWREWAVSTEGSVILLALLGAIAALILTTVATADASDIRPDQWLYGRYEDMFLLPVIAIGLMQTWRKRWAVGLALFVLAGGFLLTLVASPTRIDYANLNKLNLQAFWPLALTTIFHRDYFWLWGILGAIGVFMVGLVGSERRKPWLFLLLVPVAALLVANNTFHYRLIRNSSHPAPAIEKLASSLPAGSCIGFTTGNDPSTRFALYTFYLHTDDLRRITMQEWQTQCQGKGLYLTYSFDQQSYPHLVVAATDPEHDLVALRAAPGR